MAEELIDILDMKLNIVGIENRTKVHREGLIHQTFHCWLFEKVDSEIYVLFQKRQTNKDTFPSFFDVTAAGHLSSGETIEDGVRELHEELGINCTYEKLKYIGPIYQVSEGDSFTDREFNHMHLLKTDKNIDEFDIQFEELQGIGKVKLEDLEGLLFNDFDTINMEVCLWRNKDINFKDNISISKGDIVPHSDEYFKKMIEGCREI